LIREPKNNIIEVNKTLNGQKMTEDDLLRISRNNNTLETPGIPNTNSGYQATASVNLYNEETTKPKIGP
jgi:hypothetical protein